MGDISCVLPESINETSISKIQYNSITEPTNPSIPPSSSDNTALQVQEEKGSDSECEIVSITSSEGEMKWRNINGPFCRLNALIDAGYDNPKLLLTRLFNMDESMLPTSQSNLWGIVFSVLSEPVHRQRLKNYSSLESFIHLLDSSSRILVLTGAGISVSCGIPDFRSKDGVYARLSKDYPDLTSPQAMFDMDFFVQNPNPFFKFAKEIFPGQFKPSFTHRFISLLEKKGKLLRNYTQNIDTLEQAAGITRIIQCHGSFATATCTSCSYSVPGISIREAIMNQTVPKCPKCSPENLLNNATNSTTNVSNIVLQTSPKRNTVECEKAKTQIKPTSTTRCLRSRRTLRPTVIESSTPAFGVMKPDIVFFGEGLPSEFHDSLSEDIEQADLVIVMGSSLKVRPVSHIPHSIPPKVPQMLINRESLSSPAFDVELLGNCDEILAELCLRLGWNVSDIDSNPEHVSKTQMTEVDLRIPLKNALLARTSNNSYNAHKITKSYFSNPVKNIDNHSESVEKDIILDPTGPAGDSKDPTKITSCSVENILHPDMKDGDEVVEEKPLVINSIKSSNSSSPINVDESSSDVSFDAFNISEFLPDNSFTRIPPNQYIFDGAEVLFDYEMAEECAHHEGELLDDECSSSDSNLGSEFDDSELCKLNKTNPSNDRFMMRILKKCEKDIELQAYRNSRSSLCSNNVVAEEQIVHEVSSDSDTIVSTKNQPNNPIGLDCGVEDDCFIVSATGIKESSKKKPTNDGVAATKRRRCNAKNGPNSVVPVKCPSSADVEVADASNSILL